MHDYTDREQELLVGQANALTELLRYGTAYQAGCGVGAQTVALAPNSPHPSFVSVDIAHASLVVAVRR